MNRGTMAFMVCAIIIAGCVTAPVSEHRDRFDGFQRFDMSSNFVRGNGLFQQPLAVQVNAQKLITSDSAVIFNIVVDYNSDQWLFIRDGESLVFLIDGVRVGLSGDGSLEHRSIDRRGIQRSLISASGVKERAFYRVDADFLRRIANAKTVEIKLIGKDQYMERVFDAGNIANFKEFVKKYVDA